MLNDMLYLVVWMTLGAMLVLYRRKLSLWYAKTRRFGQSPFLSQRYRSNLWAFTIIGVFIFYFAAAGILGWIWFWLAG